MSQSIGIFDSGLGGCTVAHAIYRLLPKEKLIYFGDTLHFPYGDKAPETIIKYSEEITRFLIKKKSKIVVIACNTASAHAHEQVKKICEQAGVLAIDVIHPIAEQIANASYQKIGIIGTRGTIQTQAYDKRIHLLNPNKKIQSLATPLLAPMVEEGIFNHPISRLVLQHYLEHSKLKDIEALVLGCTHYPLLYNDIEAFYDYKMPILDGAHTVALAVQKLLKENNLLSEHKESDNEFYISEFTPFFEQSACLFFQDKIQLKIAKIS